jgi:hypothetical protein
MLNFELELLSYFLKVSVKTVMIGVSENSSHSTAKMNDN